MNIKELIKYMKRTPVAGLSQVDRITIVEALEKWEPQIRTKVFGEGCRSCGFLPREFKMNNCPNCGQRWKWED